MVEAEIGGAIASGALGVINSIIFKSSSKKTQMNFFWKHKTNHQVINHGSLNRLPDVHKAEFEQTDEEPTHEYGGHDEDGYFLKTLLAAEVLSELNSGNEEVSDDTNGQAQTQEPSFQGFGGGSAGGAGAEGDFSPNTNPENNEGDKVDNDGQGSSDTSQSDTSSSSDSSTSSDSGTGGGDQ